MICPCIWCPCCMVACCIGACCIGGGGGWVACCSCCCNSLIFLECSATDILGMIMGCPSFLFLIALLTIFMISTCSCSFSMELKFLRILTTIDAKDKSKSSSASSEVFACDFSNMLSIALCICIRCFAAAVILLAFGTSCRCILFEIVVLVEVDGQHLLFCSFWKAANASLSCISSAIRWSGSVVTMSSKMSWIDSTPSWPLVRSTGCCSSASSSTQFVSRL